MAKIQINLQFPGSSSPERQRLCAEDSLASPGTHSAKTCTKCRSVLPLGEFYINSCNGQRVSQCKSCCRAKAIERRELKLEHCRNQERLRALTKSRRVGAARDSAKERAHKVVQRLINSGGLRLLQVFPSPALGGHTLHSQTSAMAILRALGVGARVDCDGAMRAELPSGWGFILHRAGSSFFVPAPQPGSAQ